MRKNILIILIMLTAIVLRILPIPELTSGSISHNVGLTLAVSSQNPEKIFWQFLNDSNKFLINIFYRIKSNREKFRNETSNVCSLKDNYNDKIPITSVDVKDPILVNVKNSNHGVSLGIKKEVCSDLIYKSQNSLAKKNKLKNIQYSQENDILDRIQILSEQGLYTESIDMITVYLKNRIDVPDKIKILLYRILASNYVEKGIKDNKERKIYFNKALVYFTRAEKISDVNSLSNIFICSGLGFIHYQYKNYDRAVYYLRKGLSYPLEGFEKQHIDMYTNLGCINIVLNKYNEAIEFFNKALDLNPFNHSQLIPIYEGLASGSVGLKEYERAIVYLEKGLTYISHGYEIKKIDLYTSLGFTYMALNKYDKSIEYFRKGLKLSPSSLLVENIYNSLMAKKKIIPIAFDQAPLRYIILHFAVIFGRGLNVIRFPAFLFGIACILLIYRLGKLTFGVNVGLLSSFFLAFSLWHIHHSTYAATYTLYVFLSILSVMLFYKNLKKYKFRTQIQYVVVTVLGIYSFYPFAAVIIGEFLWFYIFFKKDKKRFKIYTIFLFAIIILIAPLFARIYYALGWKTDFGDFYWGWKSYEILPSLLSLFGGINFTKFIPINLFIFLIGMVIGLYRKVQRKEMLFCLMVLIAPCFFLVGASLLFKINLAERYFLFVYPFFIIVSAYGIMGIKKKIVSILFIILFNSSFLLFFLNVCGAETTAYIPKGYLRTYGDFEFVAECLEKNYKEGDAVIITHAASILAVQYYLDKENLFPVKFVKPACKSYHYYKYDGEKVKNFYGLNEYQQNPIRINKLLNEYKRLWLVAEDGIHHYDKLGSIQKWINKNYSNSIDFKGGKIYLFENKTSSPLSENILYGCTKAVCYLDCANEIIEIKYPFNHN